MFITGLLLSMLGGALVGGGVGAAIGFFCEELSEDDVRSKVADNGAAYAYVKKVQPNVLTTDIIDRCGDVQKEAEFKTNSMKDHFYVGQKIYA